MTSDLPTSRQVINSDTVPILICDLPTSRQVVNSDTVPVLTSDLPTSRQVVNNDTRGLQTQTHPQVDKEAFRSQSTIRLKNAQKPFPVNTDVGVLR